MPNRGAYGRQLGGSFGSPDAPTLVSKALPKSTLAVTELRFDHPLFGRTAPLPREDAWLVALQLRDSPNQDLYFDGRLTRPENYQKGATSFYDLRREPTADIRDPFHSLVLYLPRRALDTLAYESGSPRPGDLRHKPGVSVDDPTVRNLLSSLLPTIARPETANSLFVDHVVLGMTAHMACAYAGMEPNTGASHGGLAPWQQRRALEMMSASLNCDLPLSQLASECGLSVRHFARAFRQSVGMPPHRWLLRHRINCSKELLRTREWRLADVATFCGFADQSHFTRVFTASVGVSPGLWQRMNAGRAALPPVDLE